MYTYDLTPGTVVRFRTYIDGKQTFGCALVLYPLFDRFVGYTPILGNDYDQARSPMDPDTITIHNGTDIEGVYALTEMPGEWLVAAWDAAKQAPGYLGSSQTAQQLKQAAHLGSITLDCHRRHIQPTREAG